MFEEVAVHIAGGNDIRRIADCFTRTTGDPLMEARCDDGRAYLHTYDNPHYFARIEEFDPEETRDFIGTDGMPFDELPIIVTFEPYRTPPGAEERRIISRDMAVKLGKAVFEELGRDCLVAESMQRLVAVFKSPNAR